MGRYVLAILLITLVPACAPTGGMSIQDTSPERTLARVGPQEGTLMVAGGGRLGPEIWTHFVDLAGGPDARIVVIPTAGIDDTYSDDWHGLRGLKEAGATNVVLLHTRDRNEADSEEFALAVRGADAVWFPGGRQWRLVDSYLNTRVHDELFELLERGGVIGGTSAGASIQASFLVRGDPSTNQILISPEYQEGFGFLTNAAVDQHLHARNRQDDLWQLLETRPELLGIGIDEGTAVVIRGNRAEVIGAHKVVVYDASGAAPESWAAGAGMAFDLGQRGTRALAPYDAEDPAGVPAGATAGGGEG